LACGEDDGNFAGKFKREVWLPPPGWIGLDGGADFNQQRDAGLGAAIEVDVQGKHAGFAEFQLLDVNDEILGDEVGVVGKGDGDGEVHGRHDGAAIGIDEIQGDLVVALIAGGEGEAEGDGALGMNGGQLLRVNGVERPEEVEFLVVVRGGVAQDGYLDIHRGIMKP